MGIVVKLIAFFVLMNVYVCEGKISDKRLCADPACSKPISRAKTLLQYTSDDLRILSFAKNVDCIIFSKSAGSRQDLWGAEIKGKRGYVPKSFVRENKIFATALPYIVDTEEIEITIVEKQKIADVGLLNVANTVETSKHDAFNLETKPSGLEPDTGSGEQIILTKTPSLDSPSAFNLPFVDIGLPSFSGSGVSAEAVQSDTPPSQGDVSQPYEVIAGTTVYYDTDGAQSAAKSPVLQPTVTTQNLQPSAVPKQSQKPDPASDNKDETPSSEGKESLSTEEENVSSGEDDEQGSASRIYEFISSFMPEDSASAEEKEEKKAAVPENESVETKREAESVQDDKDAELSQEVSKEEETVQEGGKEMGSGQGVESKVDAASTEASEEAEEAKLESGEDKKETGTDRDTKDAETVKEAETSEDSKKESEVDEEVSEEDGDEEEDYDDEEEEEDEGYEDEEADEVSSKEETKLPNMESADPKSVEDKNLEDISSISSETGSGEALEAERLTDIESTESSFNVRETDIPAVQPGVDEDREVQGDLAEKMNDVNKTSGEFVKSDPSVLVMPERVIMQENTGVNVSINEINTADGKSEEIQGTEAQDAENGSSERLDESTANVEFQSAVQSDFVGDTSKSSEKEEETVKEAAILNDSNVEEAAILNDSNISEDTAPVQTPLEQKASVPEVIENLSLGLPSDAKEEFASDDSKTDSVQEHLETVTESASAEQEYIEEPQEREEVVTETSIAVEYDVEVPPYEQNTEEDVTTTSPPEEEKGESLYVDVEKRLSEEDEIVESSEGFFSGVFNSFTSVFSGAVSDSDAADEVNHSTNEITTEESLPAVGDAEEVNRKRDAAWSSLWGGPSVTHNGVNSEIEHQHDEIETKSSACSRVDYDPSAGIDSECSDVAGALPTIQQEPEEVPIETEDAVTVKYAEDDNLTMELQKSSYDTFIYLVITAITVLFFSLGHYYLEKKRRDGTLVAKINGLEKALLVSSKECLILKDDLQATKEKLLSIENFSTDSGELVTALNVELEESKAARTELEEQVASLEKELEQATEAGLELNRMLQEFLTAQHGSDTVMKSVEHLQKQLDSQQSTISTMTASLTAKNTENESLQADLSSAKDRINSLEEDMQKVNENLNDVLSEKLRMEEELLEKNKSLQDKLNKVTENKAAEISRLQNEVSTLQDSINELKDNLVTKDSEVSVLQDCLKQLRSVDDEEGEDKLQALLDVGQTKAELKLMTIERDTLAEKLQGEEDARKLLEDHVNVISEEVTRLRESYEEAEKEKVEAQTRLEVLSNYFKEKETQLQKELGLQEAMCLQKQGDATTTSERIKFLQEEIENYNGEVPSSSDVIDSKMMTLKKKKKSKRRPKLQNSESQNETLKKEILDQERGLKCQLATLEKKAHENWVTARQVERKLEESKQEASQLRNRLTIVEKNATNVSKNGETPKINDRMPGDSNGELPTSPVRMGISALQDSLSSPLHYDGHPASPPLPALIPGQPLPPSPFMGMPPPGVFMPPPPGAPFMPPPPSLFPGDRRPPPLGRMSSPPPRYSPPPPDRRGNFSPYDHSPPPSPPPGRYRSPPPRGDDSPDRFRQHRSPPPPAHFNPYSSPASRPPPHWDDSHGTSRSGFRPLPPPTHRDSPREPKGSALSSGHSSESLEKSSRHSGRV